MRKIKNNLILHFCLIVLVSSCSITRNKKTNENTSSVEINLKNAIPVNSKEAYLKRMQWWQDAKYGMFIHWGLYSSLGGEYKGEMTPRIAEWIQNTMKIPLVEYKRLMKDFTAEKFNADEWVSIAKAAGMKYIVLTSKHHEGFALFDSKVSDYNVMNTPYGKDVVKELKEACAKQGMRFGLYYSHLMDWEHPHAYTGEGKMKRRINTLDFNADEMDRSIYLKEKSFPQLREILTNYGKIDLIWYDMGAGLNVDEIEEFVDITRELQPEIIISSRIGLLPVPKTIDNNMLFDYITTSDNYFTGDDLSMPWEMPGTTNSSWGYRKDDHEWRGAKLILSSLIASASRNGNYLLNVGPMANGEIPSEPIKNLKIVGNWLHKNGEAIYDTKGSSFPWNYNWGYITEKPQNIYLHILNWPNTNTIELNGLLTNIDHVSLLEKGTKLKHVQKGRFLTIDLTGVNKDDLATVLVVHYKDSLLQIDPTISQSLNNTIRLDRVSSIYNKEEALSTWKFKVETPGNYKIQVISNEKGKHENPEWRGSQQIGHIEVAGKTIPLELKRDEEKVNPTLFFYKEIRSNVGEIKFPKKGVYELKLNGFEINAEKHTKEFGLNRIELIPVK
tara:strand:- start:18383 stop:20224 length:1842 start_codon:yes stop_codon:yes gene_type:complete